MSKKLLFAFDLSNKPISSYNAINSALEKIYLKENIMKVLNTTYVIKHPTDTPKMLLDYMVTKWLILDWDHCFCDNITASFWWMLTQSEWIFVNS